MADEDQNQAVWPLPKFYFRVTSDDFAMAFQEVSGLDVEADPIEYRAGNSKVFSKVKMPGSSKYGTVTMTKGVCSADSAFWDWFNTITTNTIERRSVTIALLDQSGDPTMTWTLRNAFPVKITGTDLKSEGNEIGVDSIEIAHEGVEILNG